MRKYKLIRSIKNTPKQFWILRLHWRASFFFFLNGGRKRNRNSVLSCNARKAVNILMVVKSVGKKDLNKLLVELQLNYGIWLISLPTHGSPGISLPLEWNRYAGCAFSSFLPSKDPYGTFSIKYSLNFELEI